LTIYNFSIITSDGFPYYDLKIDDPPEGIKLYLRFFDFSKSDFEEGFNFNQANSFELHAGLISALFKFARSMNKKIDILEFISAEDVNFSRNNPNYSGNVLITTQTEPYLFHRSVYEKIKLIYNSTITSKIPLSKSMNILPTEEENIINILTDIRAKNLLRRFRRKIEHVGTDFLLEMKNYGLNGICITSFDLSPITVIGRKYLLEDIHEILRNIGNIPEISPLNWIYRQSTFGKDQIWVYIYKSNIGPTVNGLFEPYFYLLFCEPHSYLGEIPEMVGKEFNKILM
jgi:hypothetical protein